jgi:DNA alkylation repair enzyme.
MNISTEIKQLLQKHAAQSAPAKGIFFKTGSGHYAEHDQFIGVNVPTLRIIAKQYRTLSLNDTQALLIPIRA